MRLTLVDDNDKEITISKVSASAFTVDYANTLRTLMGDMIRACDLECEMEVIEK